MFEFFTVCLKFVPIIVFKKKRTIKDIIQILGTSSCLHMTRVGTIPVDLVIPDLNVEQRYMMVIKIETMIVP